jgi:carboxypeptidase Taq
MSSTARSYFELEKQIAQTIHLKNIISLTHWDTATMLAKGSAASRQQEIATVASILHSMMSAKEVGKLIEAALHEEHILDEWQRANLNAIKKAYDETNCISPEMQRAYNIAAGECEFVWRTARKNNDFKQLAPYLDRVFDIVRDIASIKATHFAKKPYDILLDTYNPDFTSNSIEEVYAVLKAELPGLIQDIIAKQASEKVIPLTKKIDEATQRAINLTIIEQMGFSLDHGRLDTSAHPFCSGSNDDVRLTTRYDEDNFLSSLTGTIHEVGHGLYQQNLPQAYRDQPVGGPKGMAFHESQSIIMERQACTSIAFTDFLAALLRDEFGLKGKEYDAENLYKLLTRVVPSLVRVDADEVTYPLHVILRFEIEEALIEGSIKANDLPELWGTKMQAYLGITPQTDDVGCMQDIHWPSGQLGYFPAYANGAIIASMLMQAAQRKYPTMEAALRKGNFNDLNNFLTENLRKFGDMKSSSDLLAGATGHTKIQPTIFLEYIKKKYL